MGGVFPGSAALRALSKLRAFPVRQGFEDFLISEIKPRPWSPAPDWGPGPLQTRPGQWPGHLIYSPQAGRPIRRQAVNAPRFATSNLARRLAHPPPGG